MKISRDVSAQQLIKRLSKFGYIVTRQKGSHIRLSRISQEGTHHITIPNHNPIKIGTLVSIINDICNQLSITKEEFFK
ncbi:MAG TPA: type II toxin-antitoxin system HicA family toxin [Sphingobacteriaceae bacterium]|nr:type II toxin-antitoxin system HicA family toxin [Sphingobacteriaceae bacterium]